MKLYFAGCQVKEMQNAARICGVKNILVSYYYLNENLKEFVESFGYKINLMLDSGGFSVRNSDEKIDINDYIAFIKRNSKYIKHYFVLDNKRENLEQTKANLKLMEDAGLSPIPIYHTDEPFDYFTELCQRYDYVGVGGAAKNYANIFFMAEYHNIKIHLLGNTSYKTLARYMPHSADSVSWCSGCYGHIYIQTPFRFKQVYNRSLSCLSNFIVNEAKYNKYGVSFQDISQGNNGKGDYNKILIVNCLAFMEMEKRINEGVL